jgi:hypothetical protein
VAGRRKNKRSSPMHPKVALGRAEGAEAPQHYHHKRPYAYHPRSEGEGANKGWVLTPKQEAPSCGGDES